MADRAPQSDGKTPARRKLIRGAFSVPALLAVHNGSALAASTSARMRAVLNALPDSGGQIPDECTSAKADGWTRVSIYQQSWYDSKQKKNITKEYVKVSELVAIAKARDLPHVLPAGAATDYVEYKASGKYEYAKPANSSVPQQSGRMTAVLFDKQGAGDSQVRLIRFAQKGEKGTAPVKTGAVTESAWASFQAYTQH